MSRLSRLPRIMVAPNGARRTKADHPELPMSIAETAVCARACHAAGAGAVHAHLRDADGRHWLDAGAYGELTAEIARQAPDLPVQITTEAAGRYTPNDQRRLLDDLLARDLPPEGLSVALGEMLADANEAPARRFYHSATEAGIALQHILYAPDELPRLADCLSKGIIPPGAPQLLFVLGRYSVDQRSDPAGLKPFLEALSTTPALSGADWALCAFGPEESACLLAAARGGGKARVGFENSLWHPDGRVARDNAERVSQLAKALAAQDMAAG